MMWGRELRAGLVFVLVSLVLGSLFREWRRSHEARFQDLIEELTARAPHTPVAPTGAAIDSQSIEGRMGSGSPGAPKSSRHPPDPELKPGRLDVDRASAAELMRLPGIGPSLASRILADRAEHGPFRTPEELLRVRGIGPRTLARIRPYLAPGLPQAVDSLSPNAK
jgi:competence ComEA-like helix-hairpin-helix protein